MQCFGFWWAFKLMDLLLKLDYLDHVLSSHLYLKQQAPTNATPCIFTLTKGVLSESLMLILLFYLRMGKGRAGNVCFKYKSQSHCWKNPSISQSNCWLTDTEAVKSLLIAPLIITFWFPFFTATNNFSRTKMPKKKLKLHHNHTSFQFFPHLDVMWEYS